MSLFGKIFGTKVIDQEICNFCGKQLKPKAVRCIYCGKSVNDLLINKTNANSQNPDSYCEKDNVGLRILTDKEANNFFLIRMVQNRSDPFIAYSFKTENDALQALLDLPCIHLAKDSHKIICDTVLYFGYFKDPDNSYGAFLAGKDLTNDLFDLAKGSFSNHGGKKVNEVEPKPGEIKNESSSDVDLKKVVFIKEEKEDGLGGIATYRTYKAPNVKTATEFLKTQKVTKNLYYISVITPEGRYGKDIEGVYKE